MTEEKKKAVGNNLEEAMKSVKAYCLFMTVLLIGIAGMAIVINTKNQRRFDKIEKNDEIHFYNDSILKTGQIQMKQMWHKDKVNWNREHVCSHTHKQYYKCNLNQCEE